MDQHCQPDKIPVNWLGDNDVMIIHGKTSDIGGIQECMIMFGPNSSATKKKIRVEFMSFYINDCGVELTVQQSPKSTFDGEAFPTLVSIKCFNMMFWKFYLPPTLEDILFFCVFV